MGQRGGPPKKPAEFHNNPFKDALKALRKQEEEQARAAEAARTAEAARKAEAIRRAAASPKKQQKAPPSAEDEAALFLSYMDGVDRTGPSHRHREPEVPAVQVPDFQNENAEALAQLAELVAGQGSFDIEDTDELLEGVAPGVDRNLLRSLKRGDFGPQAHLDLHGMNQVEAKEAVERFLTESRRAGKRCVRIVHGRGLNSRDQVPVLKARLKEWLGQKRIGQGVLAFATARPQDGGLGALYVLLRR